MIGYITIEDITYKVIDIGEITLDNIDECRFGYAYIIGNYVLPYKGDVSIKKHIINIGIYRYKKEIIKVKPYTYNIDNIEIINTDYINEVVRQDEYMDFDKIVGVSGGDKIFVPPIRESDNITMQAAKSVLAHKQINLNDYINKFPDKNMKTNIGRTLMNDETLTWNRLEILLDALDCDYDIVIRDKPGCPNPMDCTLTITNDVYGITITSK